jgi:hypothetical protein
LNDVEKERIWNFYVELGLSERHFNTLQSSYRTLASTWLLAAFAGIGFVLSTQVELFIPKELVMAGIGLGASIGIYLLWIIDLLFYQGLSSASFQEARILESRYAWLPQVRNNMREILQGKGVATVMWFYIVAVGFMAFLGWLGLFFWLLNKGIAYAAIIAITFACAIGMGLVLWYMYRRSPTPTPNVHRLAEALKQAKRKPDA